MRNYISRTLKVKKFTVLALDVETAEPFTDSFLVVGDFPSTKRGEYTKREALEAAVKKQYPSAKPVDVISEEDVVGLYRMPLSKFIEMSELVEAEDEPEESIEDSEDTDVIE